MVFSQPTPQRPQAQPYVDLKSCCAFSSALNTPNQSPGLCCAQHLTVTSPAGDSLMLKRSKHMHLLPTCCSVQQLGDCCLLYTLCHISLAFCSNKFCCCLQTIRTSLLDVREKAYERSGLGSSYLFRIDESWAVDATRQVPVPLPPPPHNALTWLWSFNCSFCNMQFWAGRQRPNVLMLPQSMYSMYHMATCPLWVQLCMCQPAKFANSSLWQVSTVFCTRVLVYHHCFVYVTQFCC